jgi:hypothetical protein
MFKKLTRTLLAFTLAVAIVFSYGGVNVFKMVCFTEHGKETISFVDVKEGCQHHKNNQKSCCTPKHTQQVQLPTKGCCDYSHHLHKIDDESVVYAQQNSTNHYFDTNTNLWIKSSVLIPVLHPFFLSKINAPPPLFYLKTLQFLSYIQTFII